MKNREYENEIKTFSDAEEIENFNEFYKVDDMSIEGEFDDEFKKYIVIEHLQHKLNEEGYCIIDNY